MLSSREKFAQDSRIATIWIQNPPFNTLSKETRIKLQLDLQCAINDPIVELIVLAGYGRSFSVGADIKELATPWPLGMERDAMQAYVDAYATHNLAPLVAAIDASPKPIICLMNGEVYGGGLELALSCQYRVCTEASSFRFPEVLIGIIPGALGTQLLPRLVAFDDCLKMCVGCKLYTAAEALRAGVVDQVISSIDGDANTTLSYLRRLLRVLRNQLARGNDAPHPFRRTSLLPVQTALKAAVELSSKFMLSVPAPHKGGLAARGAMEALLSCVKAGGAFERGAVVESEISKTLVVSVDAQALRYVFLAEREATRVVFARLSRGDRRHSSAAGEQALPRMQSDVVCGHVHPHHSVISSGVSDSRDGAIVIRHVGVVGSGVMGSSIAASFLMTGFVVTLIDTSAPALKKATANIQAIVASAVRRGRVSSAAAGQAMVARLTTHTTYASLTSCDLVIEAVFEDLRVKLDVFRQLDGACKPTCLLASNTSSLDIDLVAAGAGAARGEFVLGLHFFTPAHVMKLVEIVLCKVTSVRVLEAAVAATKRLGKIGIMVANLPGFVGNRCIFPYFLESMLLLEDFSYTMPSSSSSSGLAGQAGAGAVTVQCVDEAIRDFGFAIGPFQMADLSGLDVGYRIRKEKQMTDHLPASDAGGSNGRVVSPFKQRPAAAVYGQGRRYSRIGDELYHLGRLGMKTGKGFYDYTKPPPKTPAATGFRGQPDGVVEAVVARECDRKALEIFGTALTSIPSPRYLSVPGGAQGSYSPSQLLSQQAGVSNGLCYSCSSEMKTAIQERLLCPLINEAFKLLGEGGVPSDRPGDVDVIFLRGYGWPPHTGGPLFYADRVLTLPLLLHKLHTFARTFPATAYYQPAPLLTEMVKRGTSVQDLQRNPSLVSALMNNRNKSFL